MSTDPTADGWKQVDARGGFFDVIGPVWRRRDADQTVHYAFRAGPGHENGNGVVHGGMLMALADHTLGSLVYESAGRKLCSTLSLNSNFLAPARAGDWVEARARIVRRGRGVVFVDGDVLAGDKICLTAAGVWKIIGAD